MAVENDGVERDERQGQHYAQHADAESHPQELPGVASAVGILDRVRAQAGLEIRLQEVAQLRHLFAQALRGDRLTTNLGSQLEAAELSPRTFSRARSQRSGPR